MPAAGIRLGVDFGTSNTVAVVRWPDNRARPLLFDGSPLLPSAVYAEPNGHLVVGRDAVHSARLDPARFEPNPKRRIDESSVLLGDRELRTGVLVSAVLARVAEESRRTAGDIPAQVTLTCPASWGATRRLVLTDAAAAAGLGTVRLVAEPVAAATYFTQVLGRDVPIGSVVVVHDLGAGTFDASVVARTSSGFEVLAVDGRDDIGGLDIDEVVINRIGTACEAIDAAAWQRLRNPSTVEERRWRRLLWDDARVAKERLSRNPTADITVPLLNTEVHLTREELEELARPLLEQTVRVTLNIMRWANLAEGRVAGVFLVGGSTRIPLMATLLHRALGEAPVAIEQPELVVAEGSLLAGAALAASAAPAPGPHTQRMMAIAAGSPVSTPPAYPVSGVPVSGSPVSASPISGSPISGTPYSGVPVSPGASPVQPPVQPTIQPPIRPPVQPPVRPPVVVASPRPPALTRPLPPQVYPPIAAPPPVEGGQDNALRAVLIAFLVLLLLAVPIIAGYVSYRLAAGFWPPPFGES
jgi:molecular chaperone DnaK